MDTSEYERRGDLYIPPGAGATLDQADGSRHLWSDGGLQLLAASGTSPAGMSRPVGSGGVDVDTGGNVNNYDPNWRISPERWRGETGRHGMVDDMRRSETTLQAAWLSYCVLAAATDFDFKPPENPTPAEMRALRLVRRAYFDHPVTPFAKHVGQMAEAIPTGTALAEVSWMPWKDPSGGTTRLTVADFAARPRYTIKGWTEHRCPDTGATRWGLIQQDARGDEARISPDRLIHFRFQADGNSPEGTGTFRACYAPWSMLMTYTNLETAMMEKGAFGVPYVEAGPGVSRGNDEAVRKILEQYRVGQYAHMVLPRGYELKFAKLSIEAQAINVAMMKARQNIARATASQHLFTGESAGAYNLWSGQALGLVGLVQSFVNDLAALHSHGHHAHVRRLVDANFRGMSRYPKLCAGTVRMGSITDTVNAVKTAKDAGFFSPGPADEVWFRDIAHAPAMDEAVRKAADEARDRALRQEQATPIDVKTEGDDEAEGDED